MHNLNWDDVRYFLAVVHHGSLSAAARTLGVNQTTVSRRISALETHLASSLFERSGQRWVITAVGEHLVGAAEAMADQAHTLERQVMADSQALSGRLRVTVADLCTQRLAMPAIATFAERYPEVALEIIATPDALDLAAREADIALRSTDEPPANLVGTRIARLAYAVYGTRERLAEVEGAGHAATSTPCITWVGDGHTRPPWIEKSFPKTRRVYRSNDLGVMLRLVKLGMGIAQIPCALGDPEPELARIPARHVETGWGLWVLSHVDLRTTARVRTFRDVLVETLEGQRDLIEGLAGATVPATGA